MSLTVTRTASTPTSRSSDFTRICHRYRPRSLDTGEGTGPRTVRRSGRLIDSAVEGALSAATGLATDCAEQAVSRTTHAAAATRTIFSSDPDTRRAIRYTVGGYPNACR